MLGEHLLYSAALAVLAGLVFYRLTGRDTSWIIILCAWAPDIDFVAHPILETLGIEVLFEGHWITHGTLHTVAAMVFFGIIMAFLLHPFGVRFFDSLLFSMGGFAAHLVEDALVYDPGYRFLWPFSHQVYGLAWLPAMLSEDYYVRDFYNVMNTEIALIGLGLLIVAILIRNRAEGTTTWIRWYMPGWLYRKAFEKWMWTRKVIQ